MKYASLCCLILLFSCHNHPRVETNAVQKINGADIPKFWSLENLSVATFRNGDSIPEARTAEEWQKAGNERQPAWCHYENDPANDSLYGKLYNWFAVSDARGLAPKGWHVATKQEWEWLAEEAVRGAKFKSLTGWKRDGNGENSFSFNAMPAGERHVDGAFSAAGDLTGWWTANSQGYPYAWQVVMYRFDHKLRIGFANKAGGGSVRVVRDR